MPSSIIVIGESRVGAFVTPKMHGLVLLLTWILWNSSESPTPPNNRPRQARKQLGTPGGAKSFPQGPKFFELRPTNFSREGEKFSRGFPPAPPGYGPGPRSATDFAPNFIIRRTLTRSSGWFWSRVGSTAWRGTTSPKLFCRQTGNTRALLHQLWSRD